MGLPIIGASLVGAAGLFSAFGAIQQGASAKAAANYNAQVAENQAIVAEQNAELVSQQRAYNERVAENNAILAARQAQDARERGIVEEMRFRQSASALRGRQAALLAAAGVDISSGGPLQVLGDSAAIGELDALQIRSNAEREAFGFEVERSNILNNSALESFHHDIQKRNLLHESQLQLSQAGLHRAGGRSAFRGSLLGAAGGLLGSAGTTALLLPPETFD